MYARFNAWRKDGSWQGVWLRLLRENRAHLDYSSVQLDGSHTPAKNGGAAVGYQGRKKARTTTALFLAPYCLGGLAGPALQGTSSGQVPANEQGELQGSLTSLTPEVNQQLFTPFFSTKRDGQGIGLTLVRDILLAHGFPFSLQAEPNGRTAFRIDFAQG